MNEVLNAIKTLDKKISFLDEKINSLDQKIVLVQEKMIDVEEKFDEKLDNTRKEFIEKLDNTRKEFNEKLEDTKKELLDRQFLFEHEYGEKINAMYDIMMTTKDKEYDNHKEIEKLDNRLTRAEANIFKQGEDIKVLSQTR